MLWHRVILTLKKAFWTVQIYKDNMDQMQIMLVTVRLYISVNENWPVFDSA